VWHRNEYLCFLNVPSYVNFARPARNLETHIPDPPNSVTCEPHVAPKVPARSQTSPSSRSSPVIPTLSPPRGAMPVANDLPQAPVNSRIASSGQSPLENPMPSFPRATSPAANDLLQVPANSQTSHSPLVIPLLSQSRDNTLSTSSKGIIQRRVKSIRCRSDLVTWYQTRSGNAIPAPSTSSEQYSHVLQLGDLRLHQSLQDDQLQSWVWVGSRWADIRHGDAHPNLPGYCLKLAGPEPNWVTRKTAIDDRGRAKKVAMAATPIPEQGVEHTHTSPQPSS